MPYAIAQFLDLTTIPSDRPGSSKPYEHHMVRTDSRAQTLHAYMHAFQAPGEKATAADATGALPITSNMKIQHGYLNCSFWLRETWAELLS
jgi:hypothetical protein